MSVVQIRPDVWWIGVNDRTTDLFEGIWPITQEGISYNSYLINDEKKVLIDLAKAFKTDEFFHQIEEVMDPSELDYIVLNHMEPDHTGIIDMLRRIAPRATILLTEKAQEMLKAFFNVTENVRVVKDGEKLSLGRMTLQFFMTPFVHWPETMMTYETTEHILFSCDGFGGYGALRGAIFDDEYSDPDFYEKEALRYFVNIVAVFSRPVIKAIEKLQNIPVKIIAPSHGLIWRARPERIIELYSKWSNYAIDDADPGITMLYGSMYGNTEKMMNAVCQGISKTGLPIEVFDVARTHVSYILPSLWVNRGVIVGAPTYEGGLFPPMAHTLDIASRKHIWNRKTAYFGSYAWSGGAKREFTKIAEGLKWEIADFLEFRGGSDSDELKKGEEWGRKFGETLKKK